jgi:hypothetical protein
MIDANGGWHDKKGSAVAHARASARRVNFPMTIHIGARIGRILENAEDIACIRRDPDGVM